MRMLASWKPAGRMLVAGTGLLLLAACAETQLASHVGKEASGTLYTTPEFSNLGKRKVGQPYQIAGVWYHPKEDPTYDETGIASWYGPGFHGKQTANGERFDQYKVSAAHTTLPMPSLVRVTNLENGRSLVVRVNDRGPFAHGRIIDLSRRAAQLLGFEQKGTAKVRVQAIDTGDGLGGGEIQVAQAQTPAAVQSPIAASPRTAVTAQQLPAPGELEQATSVAALPSVKPEPLQTRIAVPRSPSGPDPRLAKDADLEKTLAQGPAQPDAEIFVQAGAFTERENARRLSEKLSRLAQTQVSPVRVQGVEFYRVRLGPIANVATADRLLDQLEKLGHTGARIVVN